MGQSQKLLISSSLYEECFNVYIGNIRPLVPILHVEVLVGGCVLTLNPLSPGVFDPGADMEYFINLPRA